jgi:hypothetical protein
VQRPPPASIARPAHRNKEDNVKNFGWYMAGALAVLLSAPQAGLELGRTLRFKVDPTATKMAAVASMG